MQSIEQIKMRMEIAQIAVVHQVAKIEKSEQEQKAMVIGCA